MSRHGKPRVTSLAYLAHMLFFRLLSCLVSGAAAMMLGPYLSLQSASHLHCLEDGWSWLIGTCYDNLVVANTFHVQFLGHSCPMVMSFSHIPRNKHRLLDYYSIALMTKT